MPSAKVIKLARARHRQQVFVRTLGADEVNAVFSEIDAHLEAFPYLQEEALAHFPHGDNMVTFTTADSGEGQMITKVAPTAALLNFLEICRRAASARGLTVRPTPPPVPPLYVVQVVALLAEHFGIDARLYQVARALGLPLDGHAHSMAAGVGTL